MNNKKTFKLIVSESSSTSSIEDEKIENNKKIEKNMKNIKKIKKLLSNYIIEDNKKHHLKDDSEKIFNLCLIPKKNNNNKETSVSDSDLIEFINN